MSNQTNKLKATTSGAVATIILLGLYFLVVSLVSSWAFVVSQFALYWYYLLALSTGFGIQVGLFVYLRQLHRQSASRVLAVSGTTSTGAMLACCTHYLVTLIPILGVTGLVTFVAQYQVKLFWVGILANLAGVLYMTKLVQKLSNQ